jgi:hypothetical protein
MKRTTITLAALLAALVPAGIGLWGNASFSQAVPVRVPASAQVVTPTAPATTTATTVDDHGGDTPRDQRTEPGDDHGGSTGSSTSASGSSGSGSSGSGSSDSGSSGPGDSGSDDGATHHSSTDDSGSGGHGSDH